MPFRQGKMRYGMMSCTQHGDVLRLRSTEIGGELFRMLIDISALRGDRKCAIEPDRLAVMPYVAFSSAQMMRRDAMPSLRGMPRLSSPPMREFGPS